ERLAAATPFTNLAAVVLAGGYIAKGLLSAQQTDPMLFASTAHTAGDYGTMILSYASGLLAEVLGSGATVR
ncbi:MAG: hypothetical protein Q7J32_13735, partial [Sphingomonadaceae bacterium]|nr:hypothetical protein [Sphingomonadaceae bacterium]